MANPKSHFVSSEFILSKTKIDQFYKKHVELLVGPIYILLRMIEKSDYFPKQYRTSRATFIPGRTIFSLETIIKIIESVLSLEFEECTEEDFKIYGDPFGCAYTKGRGTESCNAITYTLVDVTLRDDKEAACQNVCDLEKAYNSTDRETTIYEAERIAGAGKLLASRWEDRNYTMDGKVRGLGYNQGTDPGTPIAVWEFKIFMNTDISFSGYNKKLLWAAMFSDDRSPLWSGKQVREGHAQESIDGTCQWANEKRVRYHMKGPKRPEILVFRNKCEVYEIDDRTGELIKSKRWVDIY